MKKSLYITLALMFLVPAVSFGQEQKDTTKVPDVILDFDIVDSSDSLQVPKEDPEQSTTKPKKPNRKDNKGQKTEWDEVYLDTVKVSKSGLINDYSMIGFQYGAGLSDVMWNPSTSHKMTFIPYNVGILYTRYGKMFNFMPYFGFQAGVFYTQEAYAFKEDKDSGYTPTLLGTGENSAIMNIIEVPVLAHCHIDFWKMKVLVNIGCYGGYRLSISREGPYVKEEYANSFTDYNRRFDWGLKGGAGFAFVFDPVEIHFQAMYKYSFSSLYRPDYNSDLYYRYAYPSNIVVSVGLHFQITRRTGKTTKQLKQEAYDRVYGTGVQEDQNKQSMPFFINR